MPMPTGGDDTEMITDFINACGPGDVVAFPPGETYVVNGTIEVLLRNDITINVNDSTIQAVTPGTLNRAHWRLTRCNDIVINDPVVIGANPNAGTGDPAYVPSKESQHAFEIRGGSNITVNNPSGSDIYGDWIYLTDSGGWPDGITFNNVNFTRNGRQAIAIVAGRNVIVDGGTISEIRRSFVDCEPNTVGQGAENIDIGNLAVHNLRLSFLASKGADGMIDGLTMHDIDVTGGVGGTLSTEVNPPSVRRANISIINCTAVNESGNPSRRTMRFVNVDGLTVTGCTQPMEAGREMALVKADFCTGVTVSGNTTANGGELYPWP